MASVAKPRHVLGVIALTRLVRDTLAGAFPAVWVRGEVTGCRRAPSGHVYLSLKEVRAGSEALIDCVVWSDDVPRMEFEPRDGIEVEAFGSITVYPPRGRYQLRVEELRVAGEGALLQRLEELKRRLAAEGLFEPARKRPLPAFPRRVGLVTSPVGAAVRDLVTVLRRRWPSVAIVFAPVRVQGAGAAEEIAAAIRRFGRLAQVDVLIVGRGGGSLTDLWAFNEEPVVRAVAASPIPVVSAVGHEIDVTLCDHAADVRAATPSNAAELVVPDAREVRARVDRLERHARRALDRAIDARRRRLEHLLAKYGFRRPGEAIAIHRQRVDELAERLVHAARRGLDERRRRLASLTAQYGFRQPREAVAALARRVEDHARRLGAWPRRIGEHARTLRSWEGRLSPLISACMQRARTRHALRREQLRARSPHLALERGYCLVRAADGTLVRSADAVAAGDPVAIEFARGRADARIEAVHPGGEHDAQ